MKKWIILVVVLSIATAFFVYRGFQFGSGLDIRRTVLGCDFRITSAAFEANVLRVEGSWDGPAPSDQYLIRTTIGDSPHGPAAGGIFWYPGHKDAATGRRFRLEFPSHPALAPTLHVRMYFTSRNDSFALAAETSFELKNDPPPLPRDLRAFPLPQRKEADGLIVALTALDTGGNFAPANLTPQWFSTAAFALAEDSQPSDRWRLMELRVTPNIGQPFRANFGIPDTRAGSVSAPISGTLWLADGPFEIQASFFRTVDLPPEDYFQLRDIPIPLPGQVSTLTQEWSLPGVQIKFLGVYGKGASLPAAPSNDVADSNLLVFSVETSGDIWLRLAQVGIAGTTRQVDELRHINGQGGFFAIAVGEFLPDQRLDLDFVLLRDKRAFTFVASPANKYQ